MTVQTKSENKSFGGMQGVYTHASDACACEMEFSVYTPPQALDGEKRTVLYYLSGLTCTQENVTTKGGFQRLASELGLVIVCPDTSPRKKGYAGEDDSYDFGAGAGFYLDATEAPWAESYRMYSYIAEELPALIEAGFPVDPARIGLFGHSMGGHGALTIGLRHPDRFKSLSAFSPIVAPSQVPWGRKAFTGYLGADEANWRNHDATALIESGQRHPQSILIDQGKADNFLDEQLKPHLFEAACQAAGQLLELRLHEGYDHSYFFISTFMEDHLRHHAASLGV